MTIDELVLGKATWYAQTGEFTGETVISTDDVRDMLKEFADFHVKAALEEAADNAVAKENPADYGTGEIWVDRKSIINAYPLTNIK